MEPIFELISQIFKSIYDWIVANPIVSELISNLIWVLLGAVILYVYSKLLKPYSTALHYVLPFRFNKVPIHICYGLVSPNPHNERFTIEEGDITALYTLVSLMNEVYGEKRIKVQSYIPTYHALETIDNLVSLSGPWWNKVTELYMGRLGSPVIFDRASDKVVFTDSNDQVKIFGTEKDASETPISCHGIVLVGEVRTAIGHKKYVVICGGNSYLSTYASVLVLQRLYTQKSMWVELYRKGLLNQKKWGVIFKVESISHAQHDVLQNAPMNFAELNLTAVEYIPESKFKESFEYHF